MITQYRCQWNGSRYTSRKSVIITIISVTKDTAPILLNVMNSKCFHLFSFNTYEHNVSIKAFRFFQFQFNPFNNLVYWKQKSYFPKITSFRWPPFRSRHSVSLLRTSPVTLWSISTGIRSTSCWIRCFNS